MSGERFFGMGGLALRWLGQAGVNYAALAMVPLTPRRLQLAAQIQISTAPAYGHVSASIRLFESGSGVARTWR